MQAAAEKERSDLKAKLTDVESAAVISSNQRDALQRVHTCVCVVCTCVHKCEYTHMYSTAPRDCVSVHICRARFVWSDMYIHTYILIFLGEP